MRRRSEAPATSLHPFPRTGPARATRLALPGRGRGEDATESLREHGELAGGHVPERRRRDHAADLGDLLRRQPLRRGVGTGRHVLELARLGGTAPRTGAGGREPKEPQDPRQAEHVARTIDGAKDPGLVGGTRNPQPGQVRLEDLDQGKEDAEHGFESPQPAPQPHDAHTECRVVGVCRHARHDRSWFAPHPPRRRGSRYAVPRGETDDCAGFGSRRKPPAVRSATMA